MVFSPNNVRISINDNPLSEQDDVSVRRISRLSNSSRKKKDGSCTPEHVPLSVFTRESLLWSESDTRSEASFGSTALHVAAAEGDHDTVRSLLMSAKTDVNAVDGDGWTSLHKAVKGGHVDVVKTFISDLRINVNIGGGYIGCTPLHLAAMGGNNEIIKSLLLHNRINVNAMDKNGSTALHILSKESCKRHGADQRYIRCIKTFMERPDLKVNKPDMYGHTALSHAVKTRSKETIRTILQYHEKHRLNLETSAADEMKTVRQTILLLYPEFKSVLPPPLQEDINSPSSQTRLLAAIQHNDLDVFRDVLKKPSINIEHWYDEPYYCTCLELACNLEGRHKFVQILVDSGANVNTVNPVSDVPLLHMAAKRGNLEQLSVLLNTERIDLNIKDCCQRTALHCLARLSVSRQEEVQGLQQILALILEGDCLSCRMIDLNAMDEWGNTALHVASRCGNSEMVDILLRNGADINLTDGCGETALHIAARDGNQDTVVTLMKHGADLMFTKFRQPPLAQIDRATLRKFFDECLETNDKTPQHQDFRLTFNYNFLAPKNNNIKDKKIHAEMPIMLFMSQDRRLRHMLKHPIITSFLYLKWNYARSFFYMNLLLYTLFLCFLTAHIILTDYSVKSPQICHKNNCTQDIIPSPLIETNCSNCTNIPRNESGNTVNAPSRGGKNVTLVDTTSKPLGDNSARMEESTIRPITTMPIDGNEHFGTDPKNETDRANLQEDTKNTAQQNSEETPEQLWIRIGLSALVIIIALRELMQLLSATKQYLKRPCVVLRFAIIILTSMLCSKQFDNEVNHHLSSIAILLAWFEFLFRIGGLPACSIHMQMLQTVSYTFIKCMLFYSPLIVAFSLCIYTMLHDPSGSPDPENPYYSSVGMTIVKSVLMLNGEYEASDMKMERLPITSHVILVVFILLIGVVLLNLLSGLAVSDTQAIKNDAETLSLIARVRLISSIENLVSGAAESKWILPRCITILTPNLCSVFKCYPEKQVHVFPNRRKGNIYLDESEPRLNTGMAREIISNALKQSFKKNGSSKSNESIHGIVARTFDNENGSLVSKRVKDLCEQQEFLTTRVKEMKNVYESKLTRVEEQIKSSMANVISEIGVKYDLLATNIEKVGKEMVEKKSDIREDLCQRQSGMQEDLVKQSEQMGQLEQRLSKLEESVLHTRDTVDQIFSLLVMQDRKK
ncbi:transient receptor potential cation channel protein painless-like [Periplaneta americana]|uniref:transient receptor potential cation channel protein painless-like n=1 Tax=Periplaneta americana TaxID=6978 RepID=UPI0037E74E67